MWYGRSHLYVITQKYEGYGPSWLGMETRKVFVWFEAIFKKNKRKIDYYLFDNSYKRLKCEPCIHVKTHKNEKREEVLVILAIYVGDILIAWSSMWELEFEKCVPKRGFELTDGGATQFMLGVEILRSLTTGQLFVN